MPDPTRILVAEDDPLLAGLFARTLRAAGHEVSITSDGGVVLRRCEEDLVDVVVLDLGLPDIDGIEVLTSLRRTSAVPVVVVSGRVDPIDRVMGLELGADDYLPKPIHPRELRARITNVLRRGGGGEALAAITDAGPLRIDTASRIVTLAGATVELTTREFELLAYLAAHPRVAMTRERLLRAVWGLDPQFTGHATVTEHVRRLRAKLDHDGQSWIATVRGVGYRFSPA